MLLIVAFGFFSNSHANAQGSDALELLYSDAYDGRGRDGQSQLTYKHSRTWSFGDNFYFLNLSNLGNFENAGNTYFEWGPRISPGKILGEGPTSFGLIRDVYLISEIDYVQNKNVEKATFLAGLSVDLALPGFQFFKLHLFNRNDPTISGHTQQMTIAWNYPFTLLNRKLSYAGFYDLAASEGASASNYLTQSQVLWHMRDRVYLGLEYLYWHNKIGRAGFNESAMQAVFRINF